MRTTKKIIFLCLLMTCIIFAIMPLNFVMASTEEGYIMVNGKKADKIIVSAVQGNGHRSFYLRVEGLPKSKITDIETITLSIGEALGDEYELETPVLFDDAAKKSFNKIAKNELDWLDKFYETDEHIALFVKESKTLGHVIDRLYIVNKETQEISGKL